MGVRALGFGRSTVGSVGFRVSGNEAQGFVGGTPSRDTLMALI